MKQLRASVFIVREFIRREHVQVGNVRGALRLTEEAYNVTISPDGVAVWKQHGVDVFEAVDAEPAYGEKYLQIRYPQMRERVTTSRQ